ncbi:MAG: P-loop NTPase [Planctomycetes bacterium]|nr:P-loop NTPase [Planctomycetota bacterium]
MDFKDYIAILWRRWWWFPLAIVVFIAGHRLWVERQPRLYRARSKLIIRLERYDPWTISEMKPEAGFYTSQNTREATIHEKSVLEFAAGLLRGDAGMEFTSKAFDDDRKREDIASYRARFRLVDKEALAARIGAALSTQRRGGTEIHEVSTLTDDALASQAYADAVAEAAFQFHRDQASRLIREQLDYTDGLWEKAVERLQTSGERLNEFGTRHGVLSVERRTDLVLESLSRLDAREEECRTLTQKNNEAIQFAMAQRVESSARYVEPEDPALDSPQVEAIKGRLYEGESELDVLLHGQPARTEEHPQVVELRKRLAGLRADLDREVERLARAKGKDFSRRIMDLTRENVQLTVELDLVARQRAARNEELARLSGIRTEYVDLKDKVRSAQDDVDELGRYRKGLHRTLNFVEGPVVVLGVSRREEVSEIERRGEGFQALFLTAIMAVILTVGAVFFVEYIDTKVVSEYDVRRHLNLPLLGVVADQGADRVLLTEVSQRSLVAEEFNTASTVLRATARKDEMKSFMICSTNPREGKTTISINLAVAMARKGRRTILVDGDLRLPQVHNLLKVDNRVGLSSLLAGQGTGPPLAATGSGPGPPPAALPDCIQKTSVPNLEVITSGPSVPDAIAVLESDAFRALIERLHGEADFVFIDTPPIAKIGDALSLSTYVDGCIFVVGSGLCEQHEVSWSKHLLNNVHARICGVILNMVTRQRRQEYYYYYSEDVKSLREGR